MYNYSILRIKNLDQLKNFILTQELSINTLTLSKKNEQNYHFYSPVIQLSQWQPTV